MPLIVLTAGRDESQVLQMFSAGTPEGRTATDRRWQRTGKSHADSCSRIDCNLDRRVARCGRLVHVLTACDH